MKRLYSLSLAALCVLTSTITAQTTQIAGFPERELELKSVSAEYTEAHNVTNDAVPAAEAAPASLDGKSFVTVYQDSKNKYNGFFTVEQGEGNNIVLKNFAEGYDVNATYDVATGKITIPTNVVIGTHSTYGDITMYALDFAASNYNRNPIVGTVDGDKVVFNYGVYGLVEEGGFIVMGNVTATEANAKITYTMKPQQGDPVTFENPLLITKTSDTAIKVVGLSGILYGAYYEVPFAINASANTATLPLGTVIDNRYSYNRPYYLGGFNPVGQVDDLEMKVITSEATSLLTADKVGYVYANNMQYSGYIFHDVKIDVNFNIFTGEVTGDGDGDEDTDTPTVDGISYQLYRDNATATVTGCLATLTTLDIPSEINVSGNVYKVNAVKTQAFMNNKTITSVSIPASIAIVETDAFRNMSNLKALYIADMAAWCAIEFANGNANPIYNVFPTSTSRWGKVYVKNTALTTLDIPEGVKSIGRAFYGFKSLTSVKFPSTLETIGDQAFANCTSLAEIEIPASVQSMGSVFFSCTGLKKVTFQGGVKEFTGMTFYGCKALESVNLSEGVEKIGKMVFSSCAALTTISIPSTVTMVDMMAFDGCSGLKEIKSYATVPPTAAVMAFDGVDVTIPVYVPANSVDAYKAADEWKNFTNYQALTVSAIDDIEADNNAVVEYYTIQGVRVDNPSNGLYIKKQGNKVSKVVVK